MPSRPQISREQILRTALEMLMEEGYESIRITTVAERLGCSTQPISWQFGGMEGFRAALAAEAVAYATERVRPTAADPLAAFYGIGTGYIDLAYDCPRLLRFITQTPDGRYTLGLRLFEYGRQVERSWDISTVARPYMEHLCRQTGASVMLSVCEGGSVITLDQVETRGSLRVVSDTGSRLPIYCTSQGKVFLAHMSRTGAEALLRGQSRSQFTPHTITDIPALLREVEACRTNGYAIENGEYKIGLRSISAPVYTVDRTVRYTVGVIGMFRSTHSDEFRSAVEQVCATAATISAALGYREA